MERSQPRRHGVSRRQVLLGTGSLVAGSLAGCLGSEDADGYAAIFPLLDWTRQVSGDTLTFKSPVDDGRSGHGWSPSGDVTTDVASTDMFIYLDSPEFAWAQSIAETLAADYDDIVTVDLLEPIESHLLPVGADHDHGDGDHEEDAGDDHEADGSEFFDPHVWLDPVLVEEMVERIGAELAALDPDTGDQYRSYADAYRERVHAVHERLEGLAAESDLDVAVFAGHNSFRYTERRYGFELVTPTGVTPDAVQSPNDVAALIDVIEEHGIETVLYDPFEAPDPGESLPQMVEVLFENSRVDRAEPLTPMGGTTDEWDEKDWGWIEQMESINRASLETALNPA